MIDDYGVGQKHGLSESCVTQEAKKGVFRSPALRRKQKRGLFRSPALRRKQKRASFGVLRYARSKKGRLSKPCVTHGAKKGVFRSPALRTEQKRASFRALRYARSKKGRLSEPCVTHGAKKYGDCLACQVRITDAHDPQFKYHFTVGGEQYEAYYHPHIIGAKALPDDGRRPLPIVITKRPQR